MLYSVDVATYNEKINKVFAYIWPVWKLLSGFALACRAGVRSTVRFLSKHSRNVTWIGAILKLSEVLIIRPQTCFIGRRYADLDGQGRVRQVQDDR